MNIESILLKSKQLTSQLIGIYELSHSGFSHSDITEMIGVATNLSSSLHNDIQNNIETSEIKSNASETNTEKLATAHQNSFAGRLKFALKEQGMTQADLAREADVSQSFISMCVNEKVTNPKKIYIELLATALNVDFEWLMNGEGSIYGSVFLTNSNKA